LGVLDQGFSPGRDLVYNKITIVFEDIHRLIAQAAYELVQYREAWLNPPGASEAELKKRTLTNLYNQNPQWLQNAHRKLDRAVFAAYGWPESLAEEAVLERLLALNLERAGKQGAAGGEKRTLDSEGEMEE
jgi:hypothetical protein